MKSFNLFFASAICFCLTACAAVDISSVPAVERNIAWDKTRTFAETEEICKNVGDYANIQKVRSCHYFASGVCRVVSTDLPSELEAFGEALAKCYKEDPAKDSVLLPGFIKSNNKKVRSITWHSLLSSNADSLCREKLGGSHWDRVHGCIYYDNGHHIVTGRISSLGHEAKHVFDGSWHDDRNIPKPGAFIGTQ